MRMFFALVMPAIEGMVNDEDSSGVMPMSEKAVPWQRGVERQGEVEGTAGLAMMMQDWF